MLVCCIIYVYLCNKRAMVKLKKKEKKKTCSKQKKPTKNKQTNKQTKIRQETCTELSLVDGPSIFRLSMSLVMSLMC